MFSNPQPQHRIFALKRKLQENDRNVNKKKHGQCVAICSNSRSITTRQLNASLNETDSLFFC